MATSKAQLLLALTFLGLAVLPCRVQSIYCDDDNCYDLLGLTQAATPQEVKQAYRKLSLKYHPDKNPDPEATATFLKISNAYEILGDESRRADYDYALEHPEYYFYNTARYYQAYYGPQADPLSVCLGLLVVLSAFQYLNQWTRYRQMVDMVKQTPAYKNKLKALELERSGGFGNRKKASKVKGSKGDLEELSKALDLHIQGAEKPVLWGMLGVRVVVLPFTILKLLIWRVCWMWRYWVKRLPYSWDDAALLTRRSLGIASSTWSSMNGGTQDDLILRRLWVKSNLQRYMEDIRKDGRRRR